MSHSPTANRDIIHRYLWPEGAEQASNTIEEICWHPDLTTLVSVSVRINTVNTAGAHTITVTNIGTGNSVLTGANFDLTGLSADTVTNLVLTSTASDLDFAALGEWKVSIASNNAGYNGSGLRVLLFFKRA